jgi:hypothetical protein
MTPDTVQEIEAAVRKLSENELSVFRAWFTQFDAEMWDQQFQMDVQTGRLDELAEEALRDFRDGRCTHL